MKSIYKNKKFDNKNEFKVWLNKTTKYIVQFEDCGQDFTKWYLDKRGEVLHSEPFQASIWNGQMVNVLKMDVGLFLEFQNGNTLNYRITKIEIK